MNAKRRTSKKTTKKVPEDEEKRAGDWEEREDRTDAKESGDNYI